MAWLGTITAVGCFAAGMWVTPPVTTVNEGMLRAAVSSVDDTTVYKVWIEQISRSGLRRPPTEDEERVLRQERFASGVRQALHAVAAAAALVAITAALVNGLAGTPNAAAGSSPWKASSPPGATRP